MSSLPSLNDHEYNLVSHIIYFCRSLREKGLLVGPSETADALQSLALLDMMDQEQVYWAFRSILVSRVYEVPVFDECFRQFWALHKPLDTSPRSPNSNQDRIDGARRFNRRVDMSSHAGEADEAQPQSVQIFRTGASPVEIVARRDLTVLKGDDLEEVSRIAARLARALPSRPGRRLRRHKRKGVPDLRSALRVNLSNGGNIVTLPRRRRVRRVPRLLVMLDVSGSMDRYAGLLLQLAYALGQRAGHVETFVFSTSLTRVTRHLKAPSFQEAVSRISDQVYHWSGGTRIGECLGTLNREYSAILDRNTSVFILSDGWETGDAEHLARELALLKRQVRRLVWLNPLQGTPDYQPLTLGLQAARPYVDVFASALDLAHLRRLPGLLNG